MAGNTSEDLYFLYKKTHMPVDVIIVKCELT